MARVLLAVPPMGASSVPPQLGIGYLASALRAHGHAVDLVHSDKEGWGVEEFVRHAVRTKPDLIGFTVVTMAYLPVRRLAARLRECGVNAPLVLGGPHPTALPELSLRQTGAAAILLGEGDVSAPLLVDAIVAGRTPDDVPGVAFLADGRLRQTPAAPFVADLDTLPFPAWDLLRPESYPPAPHQLFFRRFPTAPIMTSRGCRFNCSYCASAIVWGHRYRVRSVANVLAEIRLLVERHGVREIHVVDDDFTADEERVVELCRAMVDAKLPIIWSLPNGIRTNTVNDRLAMWLAKAGCYQAGLGIDVVEQRQMRRVRKLRAADAAENAVRILHRWGIEVRGFYLLGLDTDTEEDVRRTIETALSLPTEFAAFGLATPLPGAPDFEAFRRTIDLETYDWSKHHYFLARDTPHLRAPVLQALLREAVVRFHLRPRVLLDLASRLDARQLPFLARGFLRYATGQHRWNGFTQGGPATSSLSDTAHF